MQDWRSYWFLLAGAQGMLLAAGLAIKSRKGDGVLKYLSILIGVLAIELLTNFAVSIQYTNKKDAVPFWLLGSYLLIPPSLLSLARHSINLPAWGRTRMALLFAPALIEVGVESVTVFLRRGGFHVPALHAHSGWFVFTEILPVVSTILVLVWWAWRLKKRWISGSPKPSAYTGTKIRTLLPYALLVYYTLLSLLWLSEAVAGWRFSDLLAQLLAGSMLLLGFLVFLQTGLFNKLSFVPARPASSTAAQWTYDDEEAVSRLLHLMQEEKLFVQSRLSIDDLSYRLQLPRRYVSYILSAKLHTTAIAFINAYRVEEVIRKMKDPGERHKTIMALASEAGFNSKSTFNQVFKVQTGKTPSEYLKTMC